jgi:hypothetical protein
LFNIGQIYEQIDFNDNLFPNPVVQGNFVWRDGQKDTEVIFKPDKTGRFYVSWLPPKNLRNNKKES